MKLVSGTRDLISDLHRQQRRRVLRRAAQLVGLAVALLLVGLAFKLAADTRSRSRSLEAAREHFARGTAVELAKADGALRESLSQTPGHPPTLAALALVTAQIHVEFGGARESAQEALDHVGEGAGASVPEATVARGLLAMAAGDADGARAALDAARASEPGQFAPEHPAWLAGALALADPRPDGPDPVAELDSALARQPELVAHRRLRVGILMERGQHADALDALEKAREQSRTHMGLAADEALFHAYLREELGGVADVADQLLASPDEVVAPRDRAHARLARGVAHVHAGEFEAGMGLIAQAWPELTAWDPIARDLALQAVLEAGEGDQALEWVEAADLPETEAEIYAAWSKLASGDIMESLELLAELPQEHPRVGYLQALALVEQLRFAEAGPWLDRVQRLIPGRVELEVARARMELRMGDKVAALRKLEGLAEDEPYAPRAWTGLGEAYLAQDGDVDLLKAGKAFKRAMEQEAVPAEAMLQAAEVWTRKRKSDPDADRKALDLLRRAAETNPHLPRYRQAYALYLIESGRGDDAEEILRGLVDETGVSPEAVLALVRLVTENGWSGDEPPAELDTWIERAEELAAAPADVERERARILARGEKEALGEALEKLRVLLETDPADIESRILYSSGLLKARARIEAEKTLRRGLQSTSDAEHGRLYLAWADLEARTSKRRKAAAHARVAWNRMLDEDRPPAELLDCAALATDLWIRERRESAALTIARELTDRLPYHPRAWTIRAATELGASRSDAARTSAERALELDDADARAHELHGHALLRFGYKDRAREAYERAVELAQGTPEEKEYRASLARL